MSSFSPIAVVGLGCIMPGALDVPSFWRNTLERRDLITDIPKTHWLIEDYYDPNPKAPDKTYARRGAFLPDVPFDAMGFGIPPSTLPATDTSQLIALIVAQMVLDDVSRLGARKLDLSRTSVILGVTGAQELLSSLVSRLQRPVWERSLRLSGLEEKQVQEACDRIASHYVPWQEASFPGLLGNVVAGRIANRLDTGGTNCITDAACASALTAVQTAIYELQLGHSDMAITGGCDTLNDIFMYMCFSKTPALSPSGDCRPFSDEADGTLLGEGLGMMALKRLEDAERDGDKVYAVIRGMGSSSDGRSKSVYAPVSEGQAKALGRCYESAGYSPASVDLVEGHGTGTKAGDAAELKGLNLVFEGTRPDNQWCALGSIKSQLGHTKAAAGAAGLMKVVLALHHKIIPPTIKVAQPNGLVDWEKSPFYLATDSRPWITGRGHARRASVSSFGFGGTNFHVTVEEYLGSAAHPARMDRWGAELLPFCGATVAEVEAEIGRAAAAVASLPAAPGDADRIITVLTRAVQDRFDGATASESAVRVCVLVACADTGWDASAKLTKALEVLRSGKASSKGGVWFQPTPEPGKVAFLFPGQGSQYVEMGKGLAMDLASARSAWDEADACFAENDRLSFTVFPRPAFDDAARRARDARIVNTEWAQPAIGVASVALLRVLGDHGVRPDVTGGHSYGELTALYAAGALSYTDYVKASRRRGELMAEAARVPGAMAAVVAKAADVAEELRSLAKGGIEGVVIANYNSPEQTVIAGPTGALEAAIKHLDAAGFKAVRLSVATAFHSPVVAPAADAYAEWLRSVPFAAPSLPVYSNASGSVYGAVALGDALGEHLRSPVRFVDEIEAMYNAGVRTFIEVGPSAVLTGLVGRCLRGRAHTAIATDAKNTDARVSLLAALGQAASAGLSVRFAPLWSEREVPAVRPAPKMAVMVNGSNYGKPYPSENMMPVPPNPPKPVAAPSAAPVVAALAAPVVAPRTPPVSAPVPATVPAPVARPEPVAFSSPVPPAAPLPVKTTMTRPADTSWLTAFLDSQKQAASVHEGFQRAMTDAHIAFLHAHEETSRAIVGLASGAASSAPAFTSAAPAYAQPAMPVSAPVFMPAVAAAPASMPAVAAAPASMPAVAAAPAAVALPAARSVPVATPVATRQAPAVNLTSLLLAVVSEKTGYPVEMLNLGMDLEADLGVDSIKRVEILSAMREREPTLPEVDAETMGALKTLGQVVEALGAVGPAGASAAPAAAAPAGVDLVALLLAVVAEKTGYPSEMLNLGMDLEADLGVDSIKRVEILSAMREREPTLPEVDAETMGALKTLGQVVGALGAVGTVGAAVAAPASAAHAPAPGVDLVALLLTVVAEKTGYPAEMLNLGMDLEADLGVDSIKRVEILSAMREREPTLPEVDAETMGALKTLQQVVSALGAVGGKSGEAVTSAAPVVDAGGDAIGRYELQLLPALPGAPLAARAWTILGGGDVGTKLASKLTAAGVDVTVGQADGSRGVIFLDGLTESSGSSPDFALAARVSRAAFQAVRGARLDASGGFVTVTALGGDFGTDGSARATALLGGLAGLTKTAALEHPAAVVRHIDLAPASAELHASWLAQELLQTAPVEVGVSAQGRVVPSSWLAPEAAPGVALPLGVSDVVVVSGGARGVTAACVIALAQRSHCRFVLLGRSRIDVAESSAVQDAKDEAALKRALFSEDPTMKPAAAGKAASSILAAREARANIAAMEAAGSPVRYVAVDVQDEAALTTVFAEIRASWGPITGVVHGAGVIADKRIVEKTQAQFDSVYDTKLEGARALLAATANDPLKVLCFFSSVAGRAGNIGQCDYALANEALNKLAVAEKRARGAAIVKSIGWGPWEGGMVTPALKKQFESMGIPCIPLARGAAIFVAELSGFRDAVEVVVGGPPGPLSAPPPGRTTVRRSVSAATHGYLRDHTVDDRPVLPVVMALEWFVQRAMELRPGMAVTVEDVKVLKGVVLDHFDAAGDQFEVVATEAGADQWSMELRSSRAVHYRARVSAHAASVSPGAPDALTYDAFPHSVKHVYDHMLFHGPDFQVIQDFGGMSSAGMQARLHGVVDAQNWPGEGWSTDVAALDGGLQMVVLWTQLMTKKAALPTSISSFRSFGPPQGGALSVVLSARRAGAQNTVTDVAFIDGTGRIVAELCGVEAHALPGGTYPVIASRTAAQAK